VLLASLIEAKSLEASYTIKYGLLGQMGIAQAKKSMENKKYHIDLVAKTTGMARFLSGSREEFFQSIGVVEDGLLKPSEYRHKVVRNSQEAQGLQGWKSVEKVSETIYEFDHENKVVVRKRVKSKDGKVYSSVHEDLEYYAPDDLLSLFFNFSTRMESLEDNGLLYAVGANKKDGSLHVKFLGQSGGEKEYLAILNEPIFASKDGALHVSLDNEGLCTKAILENVLLFGDIRAIRDVEKP
jgi:hypothetical protein